MKMTSIKVFEVMRCKPREEKKNVSQTKQRLLNGEKSSDELQMSWLDICTDIFHLRFKKSDLENKLIIVEDLSFVKSVVNAVCASQTRKILKNSRSFKLISQERCNKRI